MAACVLVTGATGHLGYNLAGHLAAHGYRVRAGVRNLADASRNRHLTELGVELVEADLTKPATLAAAMDGVEGVFQVAAVVQMWAKDPQREIIDPTVNGGLNVLRAAQDAGVRRVVFTSSLAAIGIDSSRERPLTEEDWNEQPLTPYAIAKRNAEREAWKFSREHGLDMVVINPATIIGPGVYRHTPITLLFELVVRGRVPFVLPADTSYIDARDIAEAMRLAFENPAASGRYLLSGGFAPMLELMRLIEKAYPRIRTPRRTLPVPLLNPLIVGDYLSAKLLRTERQLTKNMIPEFAGKQSWCSSAKAIGELGWTPRPVAESVHDTVWWIHDQFVDPPGSGREG
jgi:dihydroflavonol-4-reductase